VLTGTAPPLLCDPQERLELLRGAGIGVTIVQHFDVRLRETPYDDFVRGIAGRVDLAGFLMTPDSAFGFERRGTPETVAALGAELAYEVVVVPPFTLDGDPVTSSAVRAAIGRGELDRAAALLGRPVSVVGNLAPDAAGPGEGEDAEDAREGMRRVEFELPVALPPPGRYPAIASAGPFPGGTGATSVDAKDTATATSATVSNGRLLVESDGAGDLGRGQVRVTFA
jgi:hypothetical protein